MAVDGEWWAWVYEAVHQQLLALGEHEIQGPYHVTLNPGDADGRYLAPVDGLEVYRYRQTIWELPVFLDTDVRPGCVRVRGRIVGLPIVFPNQGGDLVPNDQVAAVAAG